MAGKLTWDGVISKIVDLGSESYESRIRKMILFGGAVVLALIIIWKIWR